MSKLRAGVIGCGGRGNAHALGYHLCEDVDLVACADVHLPAARRMAASCGFEAVYADYHEMLAAEHLDVVSMCLWPEAHCRTVLDCLRAPTPPRLINAEKPMAPTYGEAVLMHEEARKAGVALTFSHQRRFGTSFRRAKMLIDEGAIGDLQRLEMDCSNLFDWGTHWFDMMLYYNGDLTPDWVMGQIGCVADNQIFGARMETAGLSYIKWSNGVTGLLTTGQGTGAKVPIRIIGSKGLIDVTHNQVKMLAEGADWTVVAGADLIDVRGADSSRYIIDSVRCLLSGEKSLLDSENALRATELIFATYESARLHKRIVLPLKTRTSALLEMLEAREIVIPDWPASLSEEDREDGFELLFNGRNLDGFQTDAACPWGVSLGALGCSHENSLLLSSRHMSDGTLCGEVRLGCRSAAALVLRSDETGRGLEIPLMDDRHEPCSKTSTGAVRDVLSPQGNPRSGGGRWSWFEITLEGSHIHAVMNDVVLHDCDLTDAMPAAEIPDAGFIGLRCDVGKVEFRDLVVQGT